MVLIIIGMLASMALPRYGNSIVIHSADAAARRLAADLEWARTLARTRSAPQTVRILGTADHAYELVGINDPDHPDQAYTVSLTEVGHGAVIDSYDFDGDADLVFDMYGLPDSAGQVVLSVGDEQRTIQVEVGSGLVSVTE